MIMLNNWCQKWTQWDQVTLEPKSHLGGKMPFRRLFFEILQFFKFTRLNRSRFAWKLLSLLTPTPWTRISLQKHWNVVFTWCSCPKFGFLTKLDLLNKNLNSAIACKSLKFFFFIPKNSTPLYFCKRFNNWCQKRTHWG